MQENIKQVIVKNTVRKEFKTAPIFQWDTGHVLVFEGFDLPEAFQVHFAFSESGESVPQIGSNDQVTVPDALVEDGRMIYAWLYISTEDAGLTKFVILMPVNRRAKPTHQVPPPVEQSEIDQAIAALNTAVVKAETAAENAEQSEENASQYAENAYNSSVSAANAAESASGDARTATAKAQDALTAALDADRKAQNASESARLASQKASEASGFADNAQGSAQTAFNSANSAQGYSQTAGQKATEATQSAANAAQKAQEALSSVQAAEGYANDAYTAKQGAETAMEAAQGYAGNASTSAQAAETAKDTAVQKAGEAAQSATNAAQSAQAAAQTAAQFEEDITELKSDIQAKQDAPQTVGTAGQVLGLDSNLDPVWVDQNVVKLIRNTGYTTSNVVAPYDDLNTFPENEIAYYVNGSAAAHSPTAEAFQVLCYRAYKHTTRENLGKQQVIITTNNKVYTRSCVGVTETWTDWTEILSDKHLDKLIKINRNTGYTTSNVTAPYDDLNTFPENEIAYYVNGSAAAHSPTTNSFIIIDLRPYNQVLRPFQNAVQIVITYNNEIYIRNNTTVDQVWGEWLIVETKRQNIITPCYTDYLPAKYAINENSKLLFSGDSITYGVTSDAPGDHSGGYANLILSKFGCTGYNMGVSGASYADTNATTILQQLETAVSQGKLSGDYLFVFAGTNDYGGGVSMADLRTALNDTYDYIDQNFSGIVTIILPIGRSVTPPRAIEPLDNYVQTIFEVAIEHGYNILNGMSFGFPMDATTPDYTLTVMADGTHPTTLGHKILAHKILQFIAHAPAISSASVSNSGVISYKDSDGVTVFTVQLPLYAGGVN